MNQKLAYVEVMRGLAAILVALFHFNEVIGKSEIVGQNPLWGIFSFGHAGVQFFFVLSGFIIYHVHGAEIGSGCGVRAYAYKRIIRVYPLFLIAMVPITVKYLTQGNFDTLFFVKTILLIPQSSLPMLIQSWTLVHEFLFYVCFGLALLYGQAAYILILGYGLTTIGVHLFEIQPSFPNQLLNDYAKMIASPNNMLFLFGVGVAMVTAQKRLIGISVQPIVIMAIGACAFLLVGMLDVFKIIQESYIRVVAYGLAAVILVWGAALARSPKNDLLVKAYQFLGSISYAVYLLHGMTMAAVVVAINRLQISISAEAYLLLGLGCTIIVSYVAHIVFEKPVTEFLRRHLLGTTRQKLSV